SEICSRGNIALENTAQPQLDADRGRAKEKERGPGVLPGFLAHEKEREAEEADQSGDKIRNPEGQRAEDGVVQTETADPSYVPRGAEHGKSRGASVEGESFEGRLPCPNGNVDGLPLQARRERNVQERRPRRPPNWRGAHLAARSDQLSVDVDFVRIGN